jgi:uncharacterized OB-fold protein
LYGRAGRLAAKNGGFRPGQKVCEDCGVLTPGWGLPKSGKRQRWCTGCAKGHAGAVRTIGKKCADCGQVHRTEQAICSMGI